MTDEEKPQIGQIWFKNKRLDYDDPETFIFTNEGWVQTMKLGGGDCTKYGFAGTVMGIYRCPELVGTKIDLSTHNWHRKVC